MTTGMSDRDVQAPLILIIEDEVRLAGLLADYLRRAGYRVEQRADGRGILDQVARQPPDLIILDLMLPGLPPGTDGLDLCRAIRARAPIPIIIATARVEEIDRLLGLESGADDYVCKPYSPRELVARVRAVLRRAAPAASPADGGPDRGSSGLLTLDPDRLRVHAGERAIELTAVEFALLETLRRSPGRIFGREHLMERIYPDGRIVSGRTIDSHVKKLRRRLAVLLPERELIQAVYGVGYRYEETAGSSGS